MRVGDDLVDSDHRYLICMINTVELALVNNEDNHTVLMAIEQLEEYTHTHFAREEDLQKQIHYPQRHAHQTSHAELIQSLSRFKEKVTHIKFDSDHYQATISHLIDFLRRWLLDHVIKEDLLMKPYILKRKR